MPLWRPGGIPVLHTSWAVEPSALRFEAVARGLPTAHPCHAVHGRLLEHGPLNTHGDLRR